MNVKLKSLTLLNFKGIASLTVNFNEGITTISGENASGKTTIFDAFTWLLFGKNSNDQSDFEIKTLDANNVPMRRAEHSVEGIVTQDGIEIKFKRIWKEKWVTEKGSATEVFKGHETVYSYNGVPVKQTDYMAKVASIVKEEVFKLLSNPFYFNSLDWKRRREALFQLGGSLTDNDIARGFPEFEELLARNKNLELFKRELANKRTLLQDQVKECPIRINELTNQNTLLEAEVKPVAELDAEITRITGEIASIDLIISDINKLMEEENKTARELNQKINTAKQARDNYEFQKKQEYQKAENERKQTLIELKTKWNNLDRSKKNISNEIDRANDANERLLQEKAKLSDKWDLVDKSKLEIDPDELKCPTCKREFETTDIEAKEDELTRNFNEKKIKDKKVIEERGEQIKQIVKENNADIEKLTQSKAETVAELWDVEKLIAEEEEKQESPQPFDVASLQSDPQYIALSNTIDELVTQQSAPKDADKPTTTEHVQKRAALYVELDAVKKQKSVHENIARTKTRIAEIKENQSKLSQEIADIEKDQYTISEFTRHKITTIESTINSKFEGVQFKMYEQLINGGEEECCITLVNGVPFQNANRAGQINAGISIINTFSLHFGINAPIFIDNAEAVIHLQPTASQLICLRVSTDKELVVQ